MVVPYAYDMEYTEIEVPLSSLLLDPNNYRLQNPSRNEKVPEHRVPESTVQETTLRRLESFDLGEIKHSIIRNGFIPIERVVVKTVSSIADHYMVIEGNRRIATLKKLQEDHFSGVPVPDKVVNVFEAVPVLCTAENSRADTLAIMGIRHVGGPKEWGGYQSAKLIEELMRDHDGDARTVAEKLAIATREVNRRHQAFGALLQMQADTDFGENVTAEMYPIFHETVSIPALRNWLGWDSSERHFTHAENRAALYGWMTPNDEGTVTIPGYQDIRTLKKIVANEDALDSLLSGEESLSGAAGIADSQARSSRWRPNSSAALQSIQEISNEAITSLDEDGLNLLDNLSKAARRVIRMHAATQSADVNDE